MKHIALILILLTGFAGVSAQSRANGLIFTLRTDRERYALGENVMVSSVWENTSKKKVKIPTSPMIGHVRVFDDESKQEVQYHGIYACGTAGTQTIPAGEKFQVDNILNYFLYPDYDLTKPGRYTVRLDRGSCCTDEAGPQASFEIVRLDEEALKRKREKALGGDETALQILSTHGDESVVPVLGDLVKSPNEKTRQIVYQALLILNTEKSMHILGEAATAKLQVIEKQTLLMSLREMKPLPNPSLIPYLRKLLEDDYVGGYIISQKPGEPPKKYKLYTVRKAAVSVLKRFNIDVQVVEEEEMKENVGGR